MGKDHIQPKNQYYPCPLMVEHSNHVGNHQNLKIRKKSKKRTYPINNKSCGNQNTNHQSIQDIEFNFERSPHILAYKKIQFSY